MSSTEESRRKTREDQSGLPDYEVINLKPFKIEPILLARLNKLGLRPISVGIATAFIVLLVTFCSTLIDNTFFRPLSKTSTISDLWLFFTQSKSGAESIQSMPYLRDYPALFLTVTVILAVPFVYGILRSMSVLHAELAANDCIEYEGDGRERIVSDIDKLNNRFGKLRRASQGGNIGDCGQRYTHEPWTETAPVPLPWDR